MDVDGWLKQGGIACAFIYATWVTGRFIAGKIVAGILLEQERRRSEAAEQRERESAALFERSLDIMEKAVDLAKQTADRK